jgi:hypothetical protein
LKLLQDISNPNDDQVCPQLRSSLSPENKQPFS